MNAAMQDNKGRTIIVSNEHYEQQVVTIAAGDGATLAEDSTICLTRDQLEDFIDALRFIGKRIK